MEIVKKDKWMYRWYWKALGVVLFIYVLIGGLMTPLKPGIHSVEVPLSIRPGEFIPFKIIGYNSNYLKAKKVGAWLKLDDGHYSEAVNVRILSDDKLIANFIAPPGKEGEELQSLTLILNNHIDGPSVLPDVTSLLPIAPDRDPATLTQWISDISTKLSVATGVKFPYRNILHETIRNTFFHVALWLAMVVLLLAGLYHALFYLKNKNLRHDKLSAAYNTTAIVYGMLGLATGSIWAKFTWGTWWTTDVKLNMAAIAMLIYLAYFILRSSIDDHDKRARFSAAYSIFGFAALIPLIFIIPRMYDSLHPGNGGNPALGGEDLDNTLRMFFYPSIIALILLGTWISSLFYRIMKVEEHLHISNDQ